MAYISFKNIWESEIDTFVSIKGEVQDINLYQSKLEVIDIYKKAEKLTTSFEPTNDTDVLNKVCIGGKLSEIETHLSLLEKN